MAIVEQKYLKDEEGNIISPITSLDSIYDSQGGGILSKIVNLIYPVGSIYIGIRDVNPQTYLIGTTWVAWGSGKVPVGVDLEDTDFSEVEHTGGSKTHNHTGATGSTTLTVDQMPSHNHSPSSYTTGFWVSKNGAASRIHVKQDATNARAVLAADDGDNGWVWGYTSKTGGSKGHTHTIKSDSAVQPYITCYMWKRTG